MAYVYLMSFATLLAGEVWALLAKPSRIAVGAAFLGIMGCGGLFAYFFATESSRYEWAKPRYYPLPVEGAGTRTLVIGSIKDLPGFMVKPVAKGTRHEYAGWGVEPLPYPIEDIRRCGWRIVHPKMEVHFHDPSCSCSPKDYLFEIAAPLDGTLAPDAVHLEYQVNDVSWGKFDRCLRTTAGFTLRAFDGYGLCGHLPARPTLAPRIRFLFIGPRCCSTLPPDASSRRRPCASLPFTSIRFGEVFHLKAVEHAQRTKHGGPWIAPGAPRIRNLLSISRLPRRQEHACSC